MIVFQCSECGERYELDDDMGGKRVRCRECNALAKMPFAVEYKKPPKEAPSAPTLPAEQQKQERNADGPNGTSNDAATPTPSSRRMLLVGLTCGSFLTAAIAAILFVFLRPGSPDTRQEAKAKSPQVQPTVTTPVNSQAKPQPQLPVRPVAPVASPARPDPAQQAAELERRRQDEAARQKALEREQQERQRQAEEAIGASMRADYALLSDSEKVLVLKTAKWLAGEPGGFPSLTMLDQHTVLFAKLLVSEKGKAAVLAWVNARGFQQFCQDLGVRPGDHEDLPFLYMLARNTRGNFDSGMCARGIARRYKQVGLAGLSGGEKQYIRANRDLFETILPR